MIKKPELLAPAGDLECLKAAADYGADAVYIGGKIFSMRSSPTNFSMEDLKQGVEYAHAKGVRVYLTCNVLPRNNEIKDIPEFLTSSAAVGVDAFIISDLGVIEIARRCAPQVEIHVSTQTGTVNYAAANALYSLGAKRVVLARELSLEEISGIRRNTPQGLEIETFVHGAMCVSFSGRCLLSNYLAARDANRGNCAQPCRWKYALCEEKRPGQYFPIYQDDKGTFILNSKDLCMIAHIPELTRAGVGSFKIEGRAKSAYYVAAVTNAYRIAIDDAFAGRPFNPDLLGEVDKVSHREYCTGFYFGPIQNGQVYAGSSYRRTYDIIAKVEEKSFFRAQSGDYLSLCKQRNNFSAGDEVEAIWPGGLGKRLRVTALYNRDGSPIRSATHPDSEILVGTDAKLGPYTMLRRHD